ncbi:MAG: integral rane protein-like protein [Herminiimonas sp.]|nr:integral rane protein-like protein [Herminiimonas sp.]
MDRIDAAEFVGKKRTMLTLLYGCTIFLSAFLLFQVQPIIGKMLLPWFGGSAAVWSTCLLFFQVLLLLGYLYAHWTSRFLVPKKQALLHILLLASSIAVLPITLNAAWKPTGGEDPTLLIIGLMAAAIGLPYFLLSTTGPLLQAWFAREKSGTVPYRLFALSNFGSMLGLLSYPALFEPRLTIPDMSVGWSAAYVVFTLLCAMLAWRGLHAHRTVHVRADVKADQRPSARTLAMWAILAACPTILLMAVTSHLTQNVAPVPFLWVLPLGLYLMSFILCFEGGNWYRRIWYLPVFIVWLGVMNYDLVEQIAVQGVWVPIALYCSGLFVSCMLCHGELARMKPHPEHLTSFYLMIALGGATGGTFVAIVAPRLFNSNYELPAAAIATALVIVTLVRREPADPRPRIPGYRVWLKAMVITVALISILAVAGIARQNSMHRVLARNFYGTLRVTDANDHGYVVRQLVHGAILHGTQYLYSERRRWPTTYYGDNGGAGMAVLATRHAGQQRVGVIGLGAGTMAAYGRAGDYYRFYEINPLVLRLARSQFTFLSDCPAIVETAMGDARLSLEREPPQQFDVLVMDAFSGDSIPVHLLTREAFAVYFRHMRPGGILAVHISNRNLDLAPVVKHASDYYGKEARLVDSDEDESRGLTGSAWVLIGDRADIFDAKELRDSVTAIEPESAIRPWTDDYSSIYTILR